MIIGGIAIQTLVLVFLDATSGRRRPVWRADSDEALRAAAGGESHNLFAMSDIYGALLIYIICVVLLASVPG